jgi:predicted nucleotidyltransferase
MDDQRVFDPVLSRFHGAVAQTYGARLERVILFGSRARGDFHPGSDYDLAVFLHGLDNWFDETVRLAGIGADILMDTGAVISAKPFPAETYHQDLPLLREIRRDGLTL